MPREKNLRGMLRSAMDRAVSRDAIVIVDSLNNIKVWFSFEHGHCYICRSYACCWFSGRMHGVQITWSCMLFWTDCVGLGGFRVTDMNCGAWPVHPERTTAWYFSTCLCTVKPVKRSGVWLLGLWMILTLLSMCPPVALCCRWSRMSSMERWQTIEAVARLRGKYVILLALTHFVLDLKCVSIATLCMTDGSWGVLDL